MLPILFYNQSNENVSPGRIPTAPPPTSPRRKSGCDAARGTQRSDSERSKPENLQSDSRLTSLLDDLLMLSLRKSTVVLQRSPVPSSRAARATASCSSPFEQNDKRHKGFYAHFVVPSAVIPDLPIEMLNSCMGRNPASKVFRTQFWYSLGVRKQHHVFAIWG